MPSVLTLVEEKQCFTYVFIVLYKKDKLACLQSKVASLEEELRKSREEVSNYQNQSYQLGKVNYNVLYFMLNKNVASIYEELMHFLHTY